MYKKVYKFVRFVFLSGVFLFLPGRVSAQIRDWDNIDGNGKSCLVNGVPTLKCAEVVTGNLLFMSNAFILLVLFIMFAIGSFKFLTSLGSPDKMEEAKKTFTWAVIGLVVYVSAYVILFTIDMLFLGGKGDIFKLQIGD